MIFFKVWRLAKINPGLLGIGELRVPPPALVPPTPIWKANAPRRAPAGADFWSPLKMFPFHINQPCLSGGTLYLQREDTPFSHHLARDEGRIRTI